MAHIKKNPKLKRTIKYPATWKHQEIISRIIPKSPGNVIKSICYSALNAARGEVSLNPKGKRILRSYIKLNERFVQRNESDKRKRNPINQTGDPF